MQISVLITEPIHLMGKNKTLKIEAPLFFQMINFYFQYSIFLLFCFIKNKLLQTSKQILKLQSPSHKFKCHAISLKTSS